MLLDMLPHQWVIGADKKDVQTVKAELELRVTRFPIIDQLTPGWNRLFLSGKNVYLFVQENEPLFSLESGAADRNVIVAVQEPRRKAVFLGIQFGMLLALHESYIGLHGVTLLCGDEIIILSAPSGTGKTTLAHLLEQYSDAIVINGDFALLSVTDESVFFEPTFFCGSSKRSLNFRLKVDRIVFLKQAEHNHWKELSGRAAAVQYMDNCFVPDWDPILQHSVQNNILNVISNVKCNEYSFAPYKEAAEVFLQNITSEEVSLEFNKENDNMEIKIPKSKEDMAELRKTLRQAIPDDELDAVSGGNDDIKGKGDSIIWTCPFCGADVKCKQMQDAAKHMTKCPNNPYK